MNSILKAFRDYFNGTVYIPDELEQRGRIDDIHTGWFIRYRIFSDKQGEPYLDFVAYNRMTNPRHQRILATGEVMALEIFKESYVYDPKIPGDQKVKEKEYEEYNQKVSKILKEKDLMDDD